MLPGHDWPSHLEELDVIGREHSKMAVRTVASPPAFVDHFDAGNDVVWVEGDLGVVSYAHTHRIFFFHVTFT